MHPVTSKRLRKSGLILLGCAVLIATCAGLILGTDKGRQGLLDAISRLDERSRDIIALKFSSGMNNREIAGLTGLGESNVGIIIFRAVKKMQADLEGEKI